MAKVVVVKSPHLRAGFPVISAACGVNCPQKHTHVNREADQQPPQARIRCSATGTVQRSRLVRSAALALCALAAYGILHGAAESGRPRPASQTAASGGTFWWSAVFTPNAVDSSWSMRAFLPSMEGRSGNGDLPVMLWARCRANTYETTVWVHYHTALRPDNQSAAREAYKTVTVRVDSSAATQ